MTNSDTNAKPDALNFHFSTPERDRTAYRTFTAICREFRKPLHTVIGMSELTLRSDLDIEQRENLQIIRKNACRVLKSLNDVLGFFGTDTEDIEADFDLDHLLGSVMAEIESEAEKKGLFPESDRSADLLRYLRGYPLMLRAVLISLADHAIRFTEKGGITLRVRNCPSAENAESKIRLLFSVRDTGPGIPEEQCRRIFDPGLGESGSELKLGLALCRLRVERMGGTIWVNSEVGRGSEFSFTAVFEAGEASGIQSDLWERDRTKIFLPSRAAPGLNILIGDEDAGTAKIASKILRYQGHIPVIAQDGIQVLRLISEENFDMIFISAGLPDSHDMIRRIRHAEPCGKNRSVPVIVMSDHISTDMKAACKAAGADDLIVKPADFYEIGTVMEKNIPTYFSVFSGPEPDCQTELQRAGRPCTPGGPSSGKHALLPDKKNALRRLGGDENFYREVCGLFLINTPVIMEKLRDATNRLCFKDIVIHACSVKGAFGTLGAKSCMDIADRLEQAAAEEKTWQIPRLLEYLEQELERVTAHIAEIRSEK